MQAAHQSRDPSPAMPSGRLKPGACRSYSRQQQARASVSKTDDPAAQPEGAAWNIALEGEDSPHRRGTCHKTHSQTLPAPRANPSNFRRTLTVYTAVTVITSLLSGFPHRRKEPNSRGRLSAGRNPVALHTYPLTRTPARSRGVRILRVQSSRSV